MDGDVSIELQRALRLVETTAEMLGDLRGLDVCEIEVRERACALLFCAAREIEGVEQVLFPVTD